MKLLRDLILPVLATFAVSALVAIVVYRIVLELI